MADRRITQEQIKHMRDRFLCWKLPHNFNPDGGIKFQKTINGDTNYAHTYEPVGTNLFSADQAEEMIRFMIESLPECAVTDEQRAGALGEDELRQLINVTLDSCAYSDEDEATAITRALINAGVLGVKK